MSRKGPTEFSKRITVFLAETTPDISHIREEIRLELEAYGYQVVPEVPIEGDQETVTRLIEEALEVSRLAVHLIGRQPGNIVPGTNTEIISLQNELAVGFCRQHALSRLIWLPMGAESNDERHQSFLEQIRNDLETQYGAELFETPIEELKFGIHDRLRTFRRDAEPRATKAATGTARLPKLYLVCDRRDLDATLALEDHLSHSGLEIILPDMAGTPADVRAAHIEALRTCDAVLIYFGASSEQWVQSKVRDLQKVSGYGRLTPIEHTCVLVGPPETRSKEEFLSEGVQVFRMRSGISDTALLKPFVDQVLAKQTVQVKG